MKNLFAVALVILFCQSGRATAIQYCVRVQYFSNFTGCPTSQSGMRGNGVACNASTYRNLQGLIVDVYDRDETNADDFIGTFQLNYANETSSSACINFNWDGAARGEALPDVYITTHYQVRGTNSSPYYSQICDSNFSPGTSCSGTSGVTWRDSAVTDCTACSANLAFSTSATDSRNTRAMILSSAQKFEQMSTAAGGRTANVFYWYNGNICGESPCTISEKWISMPTASGQARQWEVAAHEAGHVYESQLLDLGVGGVVPDKCDDFHFINVPSNNTCAMTEGWADYISMVSWWDPVNTASVPIAYGGFDFEHGAPVFSNCAQNSDVEGTVARILWDMDDAAGDLIPAPGSGVDSLDFTTAAMAQIWSQFPQGTANGNNKEDINVVTGPFDMLNMKDYESHSGSALTISRVLQTETNNNGSCQSPL